MKKSIFSCIAFLCFALSASAQSYLGYVTEKANIRNAPDGQVAVVFPKCEDDCQAIVFNVVASSGSWLKIQPQSVVKRDDYDDGMTLPRYNGGEWWIHNSCVNISLPRPGVSDVSAKLYSSPSRKSKVTCHCMPEKILEIRGLWVKVEGYVARVDRSGASHKTNKKCTGWLYNPEFSCELCSA